MGNDTGIWPILDDRGMAPSSAASLPRFLARPVSWTEMAEEVPAWDALALCASEPNPFFESWYLLPSLRAFDRDGDVEILRFAADGELAGLLPLARSARYYRWPIPNLSSWLHDNCFLGAPLVARGLEREFWHALFDWADDNARSALFLHLAHMPLTGPLHEALEVVLNEQKRFSAVVHREERALLQSDASPEGYFEAALSGKKRKELRRQAARLAEMGTITFERREDTQGVEEWTGDFLRLEASGWKGLAGSALAASPGTASLFVESMIGAAARGRLQRLQLMLDGQPIAMLASFLTPPGAFSYKTAFDERFSRFSPGVLLQRENLALLGRREIEWTDSCAAADHPMIDHIWRERRKIGRLSIAIGGRARRALFAPIVRAEISRLQQAAPS